MAYLFASPLQKKIGNHYYMSSQISFNKEFQKIKEKLKFHEIEFNYLYELANRSNLERAL